MNFIMNGWYCAAFSSELNQQFLLRRIVGKPILLTRDTNGQARAMSNICPHRFAPLNQGVRFDDTVECPYHGLRFNLDGACVHNPHGQERIPHTARVSAYPVCEQAGVVWLWPGDPALADPAEIAELELFDRGNRTPVCGHLTMEVEYRLVLDNLLDLSHAAYLHAGTLSPSRAKRETTYETTDRSLKVRSVMRNVETPSSQALYYQSPRGDYYSGMEWISPGTMRHRLTMTEIGAGPDTGALTRNAHLITPESANSTHYFWIHTRNRGMDDADVDEQTRKILTRAFRTEDEPMMKACQENMGDGEFFSLKPVYLESDFAATRCRRKIDRIMQEESAAASARTGQTAAPIADDMPPPEPVRQQAAAF